MGSKRRGMFLLVNALLLFSCGLSSADVRLPSIFGSHMVLQQGVDLPIWGWADSGEKITVRLGAGKAVNTTAGKDGSWRVTLPPVDTKDVLQLIVKGKNEIVLEDVLAGEVWVGSGQSNMAWVVQNCINAEEEIQAANYPEMRLFTVPRKPAPSPQEDVDSAWQVCSPETVGGFSACCYFLGRELHKELKVPVGLINTSWGGTRIEPWTPPCGFERIPELNDITNQIDLADPTSPRYKAKLSSYIKTTEAWLVEAKKSLQEDSILNPLPGYPQEIAPLTHHQTPTTLYNGMVHALVPFAFKGAIWYQGESNRLDGDLYTLKMQALIEGWRAVWNKKDLPFYFVQIAPFQYGNEDPTVLARFWVAQQNVLDLVPHTGMVVPSDIGNTQDIHPRNKQEVGRRLALWALAKDYGRKDLVYSGPLYKDMKVEGKAIRLSFDYVGGGLASRDGKPLSHFEILPEGGTYVPAKANVDGDTLLVQAQGVDHPVAVRFAWHKTAEPNFMNKDGLPAPAFVAMVEPKGDVLDLLPEAKSYELVYALDLAKLGKEISYDTDRSKALKGKFDRVAYVLELQKSSYPREYVYVSMDAFTKELNKVGIPTVGSGIKHQTNVANMTVESNVKGIVTGKGLKGGNIEFWSYNYGPPNGASVPNASSEKFDFGDEPGDPRDGYGCMQVHNHEAKQTVFAVNHWSSGGEADLGIGNSQGATLDWTFTKNANQYAVKRLRVLVRPAK